MLGVHALNYPLQDPSRSHSVCFVKSLLTKMDSSKLLIATWAARESALFSTESDGVNRFIRAFAYVKPTILDSIFIF